MITYRSVWSLRVADCWYSGDAGGVAADILRFLNLSEPLEGCSIEPAQTVRLNLAKTEEELLADMPKSNRSHLRKAAECGFRYEFLYPAPKSAALELCTEAGLANQAVLTAYAEQGALDVSKVTDQNGRALAWRAHYRDADHVSLLGSPLLRAGSDSDLRNLLARARRHQCWEDIRRFRGSAVRTYDFGRRSSETDNQSLLAENFFQDGFGGELVQTYTCTRAETLKGRLYLALNLPLPSLGNCT